MAWLGTAISRGVKQGGAKPGLARFAIKLQARIETLVFSVLQPQVCSQVEQITYTRLVRQLRLLQVKLDPWRIGEMLGMVGQGKAWFGSARSGLAWFGKATRLCSIPNRANERWCDQTNQISARDQSPWSSRIATHPQPNLALKPPVNHLGWIPARLRTRGEQTNS